MSQTQTWRTFSIFISSTFADMQAERDHLKAFVFPKIEEELRTKRILLEIVDLRWGVDTASVNEADREAAVLKVCLDEIRRCKPFFIGLLGDRYGWVPPENRMKNATLGENLILPAKGKSVTALEIEFGVLAAKEQLSRSVFYFRDRLPYEEFTLEKAAKYCDEFDPELSGEERADRKKNLDAIKIAIKLHFDEVHQPQKVRYYPAKWNKEKQRIYGLEEWGAQVTKDILEESASHASDTWNEVPENKHEEQLALLDAFIESHTHVTTLVTLEGEVKVETFCGREKLVEELRQFLMASEKGNAGIILTGESGSGKSAVFAMVYRMMQKEDCFVLAHSAGISPDARAVLGLLQSWNKQLSDFLKLPQEEDTLTETNDRLRLLRMGDKEKTKTGIEKLQERFAELLSMTATKTRVVMLVDALDSFEPTERAMYMTWLSGALPATARLMVTAITSTEKKALEFHKDLTTRSLDYFTLEEAADMLRSLCQRQHKNLSPVIKQKILSKMRSDGLMAASSPLWLSLAVNNLMAIDADDFEKMSGCSGSGGQQIEDCLREMVENFKPLPGGLFLQLIERAMRIFGAGFTQTIFNAIACSRGGLRENDLESLIQAIPGGQWDTLQFGSVRRLFKYQFKEQGEGKQRNLAYSIPLRAPQPGGAWDTLQFASVRRWFKYHFKEQGEGKQWNLAHSILRNTLNDNMGARESNSMNVSIAKHLLSLPVDDTLRVSETMHHLMQEDDKMPAIVYYSSELGQEAVAAATKVLAETITLNETGLEIVASFPRLVMDDKDIFPVLFKRFVYALDDFLGVEGNLDQRLKLLNSLSGALEKSYSDEIPIVYFGYHKAVLFGKLGEIHQKYGHMAEALNYFEKCSVLEKELYEADPHNESDKHGLAVSYGKLGDIHHAMGDMEQALNYFELFNKFCKELYEANPKNEWLKNDLAVSYGKLGDIHWGMGHMEQALNYFELFNKFCKEFYEVNPHNELLKNNLAISYSKLGDYHHTMGHNEQALNYFMYVLILFKELYEANPMSESLKDGLAISYLRLGHIHQAMGHMEQALNYFEKDLELTEKLYEANPKNESLKNGLAISYSRLGAIHQAMGHMEKALNYFDEEVRLFKELYEANRKNESLKHGLAVSYDKLGEIHQAMGHMEQALNYFEKDLELTKELYKANPHNVQSLESLCISYYKLAIIHRDAGNHKSGKAYFSQCQDIISVLAKNFPQVPKYKEWDKVEYD